jgi:hypothetical protein
MPACLSFFLSLFLFTIQSVKLLFRKKNSQGTALYAGSTAAYS